MSGEETPEAPAWLSKLESKRKKSSKANLGHESGAGAACNECGPKCPGLDLHFWRKICNSCHCHKDVHDVQDDDAPGWAQFELLGKAQPKRARHTHLNMPLNENAGLNNLVIPGESNNAYIKGGNSKSNVDLNNKNTDNRPNFNKAMNSVTGSMGGMASKLEENQDTNSPTVFERSHKRIKFAEVPVKPERAGDNASRQSQSFTRIKSNRLLVEKTLICAACDKHIIFSRPYTIAEERTYHFNHFCCLHCDGPLGGKKYVPDDKTGQPICLECYDKFHAAKCQSCKNVIAPHVQGVSFSDTHWHATCFNCACTDCKKSLLGVRFMIKNEMLFCSSQCFKKTIP